MRIIHTAAVEPSLNDGMASLQEMREQADEYLRIIEWAAEATTCASVAYQQMLLEHTGMSGSQFRFEVEETERALNNIRVEGDFAGLEEWYYSLEFAILEECKHRMYDTVARCVAPGTPYHNEFLDRYQSEREAL